MIKEALIIEIEKGSDLLELRQLLVDYRKGGGSQYSAYQILSNLREMYKDDEVKEDLILDLLNLVSGYCRERLIIWHSVYSSEIPKIGELTLEDITIELIWEMIEKIRAKGKMQVISPLNLFQLSGFPTSDQKKIIAQKTKRTHIKKILKELENMGKLEKRVLKQEFLGIKEIGYNIKENQLSKV